MYEILIEHRAERDLNKLPSPVFSRIAKSILTLKKSPRSQNARKIKGSRNDWRLRVGD